MTKIAALFPGQGSQAVGMGQDVADRWPEAAQVFSAIDRSLGFDLSTLCWEGPEDRLRLTENTQPALLGHSIAAWTVLAGAGLKVDAVAGHSLGEYSAIVAAGGLEAAEAATTVRQRGRLMQDAVPVGQGAMAAILGLDDEIVVDICARETESGREVVAAANFNSPGQIVIAGVASAVERASDTCKERGARRAVLLPVSAPFHSPLMAPVREGLRPTLESLNFKTLDVPLYRNIDAEAVQAPSAVREGLILQVDSPVRWSETIRRMIADGFDTFVEVGTGRVLSGLVRRIDRKMTTFAAGTPEDIDRVLTELVGQGGKYDGPVF